VKVFISSSAFSDLENIKEYYKNEGVPYIGEQYIVSIIDHIETLSDNPDIGRKVPEFDEEKIRELIHPPFRIVYLREKNSVHIIRVWRSERLLVLPEQEI
jgi:plasmid stabilization system protein ParE